MNVTSLNALHPSTSTGMATSPIQVNIPALGPPQGYLIAVELAPFVGPYGLPGMPSLTYSGQGGSARRRESVGRLLRQFPGTCRVADTWDVSVPSADPRDIADAVSLVEMELAQGLATTSFTANVHMTAPHAWERLLQMGFTEVQLQAAATDARRQAWAWAARAHVTLPAQHQGSQHAAALGIAGMRALSARIGGPVATPYRRSAGPCSALPVGAYCSSRTLAGFALLQSWATLPGLVPVRFPGQTLFDSVARTVREPRRMPSGLEAVVCRDHGWISVGGSARWLVPNAAATPCHHTRFDWDGGWPPRDCLAA